MKYRTNLIFVILFLQVLHPSGTVQAAVGGDQDNPKVASLGENSGNISSNAGGGRFFFNFTIEATKTYDFSLTGDSGTKFDLFLFDISLLPSIIVEDSEEYTDAYPVVLEDFSTDNEGVLIQVFSNHMDGGTGDFTLTISLNSDNGSVNTDTGTSPAFGQLLSILALWVLTYAVYSRRSEPSIDKKRFLKID